MKEYIDLNKVKKAAVYFILAALILLPFLPHQVKFQYEYSKGQAWLHDDLFAPFDFPIYKSIEELSEERSGIVKEMIPYYDLDSTVVNYHIGRLDAFLFSEKIKDSETIKQLFQFVYHKGIVDEIRLVEEQGGIKQIAVISNNVSTNYPIEEVFTLETAYQYICLNSNSILATYPELNLKSFLTPNLRYDNNLTNKVLRNKLALIQPSKGLVKEGDKIIGFNEIVNPSVNKILDSLKKEYLLHAGFTGNIFLLVLGQFIFICLCLGAIFALLLIFRPEILFNKKDLIFTLSLVVLSALVALLCARSNPGFVYLIPFTVVPIYISGFFFSRPAIFIHFFLIVFIGYFVPSSFEFVLLNSLAGVTAVIGFKYTYKRGQLFLTAFLIFLTYALGYISLQLLQDGNFKGVDFFLFLLFAFNCLLIIILFQFTFLFERLFGFVSNASLIELTDTNRKLLRNLAELAPGTFQHVLQVANLSEAVIREIGGDALLVRAGALYHDIGKMKNPSYFIENQVNGYNPHSQLTPQESAHIIIEHVTYGIELAKKHKLPDAIIDFIRTHHANSTVYYFYAQHLTDHPDDLCNNTFSYPGPCPWTKELAVVMMADACEAASRTLATYNEDKIAGLIDKIIGYQLTEGYLNQANITMREIQTAKEVITQKLLNVYHARVSYPER